MDETTSIETLIHRIEAALEPASYLRWLDEQPDNDEFTGIEHTIYDLVFNQDVDDEESDEARIEGIGSDSTADSAEINIIARGEYLFIVDADSKRTIGSWQLPQWIIDLGSLAVFQRGVNQQPLLYWQVHAYLLYRFGLHELGPRPELEYWDA